MAKSIEKSLIIANRKLLISWNNYKLSVVKLNKCLIEKEILLRMLKNGKQQNQRK